MRSIIILALLSLSACDRRDETRTLSWTDNSLGEDGFKVYRIIAEKKTLIETTPPNMTTIKVKHIRGSCYAVTAFKGTEETAATFACDRSEKPSR
jgi:hypothetical protein